MSLTPLDIHHKEFHRAIRGYNEEEVDVFLDQVADEFESMFNQNRDLQEKVEKMQDKVEQYEGLEQTLQKAILTAQQAADEVQANARKESDLIVKDAELKAKEIIQNIAEKKEEIKADLNTLKDAEKDFRSQFKDLLKSYLDVINKVERGERPEPAAKAPAAPAVKKNEPLSAKPKAKEEAAGPGPKKEEKPAPILEVKIEPKEEPPVEQAGNQPNKVEPPSMDAKPDKKAPEAEKTESQGGDKKDKKLQTQEEYDDYFNESSFFNDEEKNKKQQGTEPPQHDSGEEKNSDTRKSNGADKTGPENKASNGENAIVDNVLESDQPIRYDYPEIEMDPKNIGSSNFTSYFADDLGESEEGQAAGTEDNHDTSASGPDDSGINEIS